ncbi:hypothetical protein KUCAC02_036608, partial [Chaenocephalus aceratus]
DEHLRCGSIDHSMGRETGSAASADRSHALQPVHMHYSPFTCTTARSHALQPVHMHYSPFTCTTARSHALQPVHMHYSPFTCTTARSHALQPFYMHYSPFTCTTACRTPTGEGPHGEQDLGLRTDAPTSASTSVTGI